MSRAMDMTKGECFLSCIHCHGRYSLNRAEVRAAKAGSKDIRCPHCGKVIGHR